MKLELKNEFIRGAVAGAISAVVICLFMELMERLHVVKHCWLFMAGQAVMQFKHHGFISVFSFLLHLGVGSFWGIFMAFLFSKVFTDRYYIFKGILAGLAIFFLHVGLLHRALNYPQAMREDPLSVFFIFLSYLIYGALTAYLIWKLPLKDTKRDNLNG